MKVIRAQSVTLALEPPEASDLFVTIIHGNAILMTQILMKPILKSIFTRGQEDQFSSRKQSVPLVLNMTILAEEE